jgi:hypothetical protein
MIGGRRPDLCTSAKRGGKGEKKKKKLKGTKRKSKKNKTSRKVAKGWIPGVKENK